MDDVDKDKLTFFSFNKDYFFTGPILYLKENENQSILKINSNKKSEELKNYIINFIKDFNLNLFSELTSEEINNYIKQREMNNFMNQREKLYVKNYKMP